MKSAFHPLLALSMILFVAPATVWSAPQSDDDSEATRLLEHIRSNIESGDWQAVETSMTPEAWDDWSASLVVECLSLTNVELEFGLPGIEEAQDEIRAALEKHGLDEIEITRPSIEIRADVEDHPDEAEATADEDADSERDAQNQEVLKLHCPVSVKVTLRPLAVGLTVVAGQDQKVL